MTTTTRRPVPPRTKPLRGGLGSTATTAPLISPKKIQPPRKLWALDTETTGTDFWHGCRPFFVSMIDEQGNVIYYEWDVNPLTREVITVKADLEALTKKVVENDLLLHNTKFDVRALGTIGVPEPHWDTLHDTLVASHVLYSNESHKLKELALRYLDITDDDQKALQDATNVARRLGRQFGWRVADENDPHFPAQQRPNDGWWVYDTWMPRAVAKAMWEGTTEDPGARKASRATKRPASSVHDWRPPGTDGPDDPGHPFWTVLSTYAIRDVERTMGLWFIFRDQLKDDLLWEIYDERRQNLKPVFDMEQNGATRSVQRSSDMKARMDKNSNDAVEKCLRLAKKAGVKADRSTLNSPKQLQYLLYQTWKLQPGKQTKTGYSTDADTLRKLLNRSKGAAHDFIENLLTLRKCERTAAYINEYDLRSVRLDSTLDNVITLDNVNNGAKHRKLPKRSKTTFTGTKLATRFTEQEIADWVCLHFNFNITGTDTTRFSSSQPNGQNIGKQVQKDDDGNIIADYNLRRQFGPRPGREWYSIDYSNIELRIFAYKSGDTKLIEAFEQGFKVHCVIAEVLHPKEWAACEKKALLLAKEKLGKNPTEMQLWGLTADIFKTEYESTLYQWCKNGTFALIYGAGREKANNTYRVDGAYDTIRVRLPLIDDFLSTKNLEAKTKGYVRCEGGFRQIKTYDPYCPGYRLFVPPKEPHVAVNYYIQGTAGWCMCRAINRVSRYLGELNRNINGDYQMIMTIHDELVFDFPLHPRNTEVITKVARLMEQSGNDIGVPTPVEVERHPHDWADGEKVRI